MPRGELEPRTLRIGDTQRSLDAQSLDHSTIEASIQSIRCSELICMIQNRFLLWFSKKLEK